MRPCVDVCAAELLGRCDENVKRVSVTLWAQSGTGQHRLSTRCARGGKRWEALCHILQEGKRRVWRLGRENCVKKRSVSLSAPCHGSSKYLFTSHSSHLCVLCPPLLNSCRHFLVLSLTRLPQFFFRPPARLFSPWAGQRPLLLHSATPHWQTAHTGATQMTMSDGKMNGKNQLCMRKRTPKQRTYNAERTPPATLAQAF